MKIKDFEFNMFGEKTYIVYDPKSGEAAIIDPGMMNSGEVARIERFMAENKLKPVHLILTHLHVDHVMGVADLRKIHTELYIKANPEDSFLGKRIAEQVQMFRLPVNVGNFSIDHELHDGDIIKIGDGTLKVLAVPGHSPGSIALYCKEGNFVITGDALFRGSIGRTDLPGGDLSTLLKSINSKLCSLPDDTVVYPGHGPATTIGYEKRMNPYL